MSRYLTEYERIVIETMLKDGKNPKEIAERLGKHFTTIYREIKKGTVLLRNGRTWEDVPTYCADRGEQLKQERSHNKGVLCKVGNIEYLDRASYYLKKLHYSPYATLQCLNREFPDIKICLNTLYNYIYSYRILDVDRSSLPYQKKVREEVCCARKPSYHMLGAKSIEERPNSVYKRDSFGHWEMDTVVGGQKKGKNCLLVLTERTTRKEIIRKIANRKAETVLSEINILERQYGLETFRRIFKTITCDNGVEFAEFKNIELSIDGKQERTKLYFCHPYCSGERGSNENNNKLIRRFIPKGESINKYSDDYIFYIQEWINNYPRKIFGGLSSYEYHSQLISQ